jgi:hypothetical protein
MFVVELVRVGLGEEGLTRPLIVLFQNGKLPRLDGPLAQPRTRPIKKDFWEKIGLAVHGLYSRHNPKSNVLAIVRWIHQTHERYSQ